MTNSEKKIAEWHTDYAKEAAATAELRAILESRKAEPMNRNLAIAGTLIEFEPYVRFRWTRLRFQLGRWVQAHRNSDGIVVYRAWQWL